MQAAGSAPLVLGHPVEHPETVATAIRIGRPARGEQALAAAQESGGRIIALSDEAILAAQQRLAGEGIWVEPASAAGLAGLLGEIAGGRLEVSGQRVVLVCTGHGLKDPEIITRDMPAPQVVQPELGGVAGGVVRGYHKVEGQFLPQRHGEERYSPPRRRERREEQLTAKKRRAQRFFCENLLVTVRLP